MKCMGGRALLNTAPRRPRHASRLPHSSAHRPRPLIQHPTLVLTNQLTMQIKLSALALVLAASLASAMPALPMPAVHRQSQHAARGTSGSGTGASCATSGAFCCNSTIPAKDADSSLTTFLGALGMGLENLANNLGLGCTSMMDGVSW